MTELERQLMNALREWSEQYKRDQEQLTAQVEALSAQVESLAEDYKKIAEALVAIRNHLSRS